MTISSCRGAVIGRALAAIAVAAPLLACGGAGNFVWVDDYRDPKAAEQKAGASYVLAPGDVIGVRVYGQEGMSTQVLIRPDGKISLLFLNDIVAAGYEPPALAQQLQVRLREFINQPVVTVTVEKPRTMEIPILGEVKGQGVTSLPPGASVLDALANVGGLTDYAHSDRIFVLRLKPQPIRIRFSYPALLHGRGQANAFRLREGDVIVVE